MDFRLPTPSSDSESAILPYRPFYALFGFNTPILVKQYVPKLNPPRYPQNNTNTVPETTTTTTQCSESVRTLAFCCLTTSRRMRGIMLRTREVREVESMMWGVVLMVFEAFLSWLKLSIYMAIVSVAIVLSFHLKSKPSSLGTHNHPSWQQMTNAGQRGNSLSRWASFSGSYRCCVWSLGWRITLKRSRGTVRGKHWCRRGGRHR
jgi:hypothetical protein